MTAQQSKHDQLIAFFVERSANPFDSNVCDTEGMLGETKGPPLLRITNLPSGSRHVLSEEENEKRYFTLALHTTTHNLLSIVTVEQARAMYPELLKHLIEAGHEYASVNTENVHSAIYPLWQSEEAPLEKLREHVNLSLFQLIEGEEESDDDIEDSFAETSVHVAGGMINLTVSISRDNYQFSSENIQEITGMLSDLTPLFAHTEPDEDLQVNSMLA